ncbi:hypothetical protein BC940DRAFT_322689 [Gongronella butleri]|nr:hypothetical protein BC940DRAFT_322689 [Gongronella butleri]
MTNSMLLQEFIDAPANAEDVLASLSAEQLMRIEQAVCNARKKRKLENAMPLTPPSPPAEAKEVSSPSISSPPPSSSSSSSSTPSSPIVTADRIKLEHEESEQPLAAAMPTLPMLPAATASAPIPCAITHTAATNVVTALLSSLNQSNSASMTAAIATYLATAMSTAVANTLQQQQQQQQQQQHHLLHQHGKAGASAGPRPKLPSEAVAVVKDGVEWVSFVYSHNRVIKKYTIRTDIDGVVLNDIENAFKIDNCVYPRANLARDEYKGNRWNYETECNVLGWKLAWMNKEEIGGKRGLIQRAVDCYRNLYPSMRSRRVARQTKLLNGTLRKRKHREGDDDGAQQQQQAMDPLVKLVSSLSKFDPHHNNNKQSGSSPFPTTSTMPPPTSLDTAIGAANQPKTMALDDPATGQRYRIKIHVASVSLDDIPLDFCVANTPYQRHARNNTPDNASNDQNTEETIDTSRHIIEDTICNELAWKLAWLNPKVLAGNKALLQHAVDLFRKKFMPSLAPPLASPATMTLMCDSAAAAGGMVPRAPSPAMSCMSGTTASFDFTDCLSLSEDALMDTPSAIAASSLSSSQPPSMLSPGSMDDWCSSSTTQSIITSPSATSDLYHQAATMNDMLDVLALPSTILGVSNDDDTTLAASTLPSSALQQQDLLVKMENMEGLDDLLLESFF